MLRKKNKRYPGVRLIDEEAKIYEVNFRPYKKAKRVFRRLKAEDWQDASNQRAALLTEARKSTKDAEGKIDYSNLTFARAREDLISDVMSDDRSKITEANFRKKVGNYGIVFDRLFTHFRELKFPEVKTTGQLTLPFFTHYKLYYCNELGKTKGWRAELISVKAIVKRLFKLGYCNDSIILALKEMKRPPANRKDYPDIPREGIQRLLAHIKKDRPDMFRPIYFMCRTGRRVEETTLLERRDVKWE